MRHFAPHRNWWSGIVSGVLTMAFLLFPLTQTLWGGLILCLESEGSMHVESIAQTDCLLPVLDGHVSHAAASQGPGINSSHQATDQCWDIPILLSTSTQRIGVKSSISHTYLLDPVPLRQEGLIPSPARRISGILSPPAISVSSIQSLRTVVLLI